MKVLKNLKRVLDNNLKYILFILGAIIIFLLLKIFFKTEIYNIDYNVMMFVKTKLLSNDIINLFEVLTYLGDELVYFGIIILCFFIIKKKKYSLIISINLAFTYVLNRILKLSFRRQRPLVPVGKPEGGYSFPSSHTMCACSFYLFLAYLICEKIKKKSLKVLTYITAGLIILIVGVSRIYLCVHYFSDVVAGLILGVLIFLLMKNYYKKDFKIW